MNSSRLKKINTQGVTFYLFDAAKPETRCWYVSSYKIKGKNMSCRVERMAEAEATIIHTLQGRYESKENKDDILLYLNTDRASTLMDKDSLTFPLSQIEKTAVHEINQRKTVGNSIIIVGGGLFLLSAVISVLSSI